MLFQGRCRALSGYLYTFLLLLLTTVLAGCTGTGADESTGGTQGTIGFVDVTAHAGPIVAVRVGNLAILDGSGSTAPGQQQKTYAWRMVSKPTGSTAQVSSPTSVTPSLIADLEGIYTVELIVSAGGVSSARKVGIVIATVPPARATGPHDHLTLSSNCINCHNGSPATAGEKSADHMAASNLCQACHSPLGFTNIAYVDHLEVFGNCSTCHNGVTAIGKSSQHVPTEEECSDCHNTESFLLLELDGSFDHTGISENCSVCHNGIVATGKHATHLPTEDDCSNCHITDNFQTVVFDHSNITDTCETCHNGVDAIGKNSALNHPVTSEDCGMCHNTDNFTNYFVDHSQIDFNLQPCASCHDGIDITGMHPEHIPVNGRDCIDCHTPGTFATGTFDHQNATDCVSCHDGVMSTGKTPDHIPTSQQCSACHGSTTSFTQNLTFDHVGITSNCVSCHDGTSSTGKPDNHIPTQLDCIACHQGTNTGDFATAPLFLNNVHVDLTSGCEGCHNDVMLPNLSKSAKVGEEHVPTAQDCRFCHVNTNFLPTIFTHNGIIDNCGSCHDGNHDLSGAIGVDADHIITSQDCGVCHTTTNVPLTGAPSFLNAVFDHTGIVDNCSRSGCHGNGAIGKDLDHVPTIEDCSVCHVTSGFANAVFDHQGIVDNCVSCHDGVTATGMSIDHPPIQIGQDCAVCHNTTSFAGAAFDHTGITGNCASCHNGTQATGKHNDHVPTNDDCVNCHNTAGFIPATFDHQGIVDNCQSCHNDIFAIGKSSAQNHPATNQDCGVCHNTTAFFPATFDHTGINSDCARSGCHGSGATGKPGNHVQTNLDCSFCHTTATFVGGTWDHTGITGNCISCHDGSIATGKGNGHFQTNEDCNACHRTTGWAPVDYNHPNNSDYPGDHNGNVGCTSCHRQNNANITFQFNYPGTCAACHANDFDAGEHNGGLNNNLNCGDSGCHRVSDRNWD